MDLKPLPSTTALRNLRPAKRDWNAEVPQGTLLEQESDGRGGTVLTATYFLTGSECRFTCSFCDLWKYTVDQPTPPGSLVRQIDSLHEQIAKSGAAPRWLKLYNASNFFDPKNVPESECQEIALRCRGFERIIVENHASLFRSKTCRESAEQFASTCGAHLEVAMGLETIEPIAESLLNKSLHRSAFIDACDFLRSAGIGIRAFVLLQPPGTVTAESVDWAVRSCEFAFETGVERCSVLPTRDGNGWLDLLEQSGTWKPPNIDQMEQTLLKLLGKGHALRNAKGAVGFGSDECSPPCRVATLDLWDWERVLGGCAECRSERYAILSEMNLRQVPIHRTVCPCCEASRVHTHA